MIVAKLISGGQTGVDRAALDAAALCGVPRGGWCPRGRRAEDGQVPDEHPLQETPGRAYQVRTEWNVRDSDGTLILHEGPLSSGTALTQRFARKLSKPVLCVDLGETRVSEAAAEQIRQWIQDQEIGVLNVAGPRETTCPGIYARARAVMEALLSLG